MTLCKIVVSVYSDNFGLTIFKAWMWFILTFTVTFLIVATAFLFLPTAIIWHICELNGAMGSTQRRLNDTRITWADCESTTSLQPCLVNLFIDLGIWRDLFKFLAILSFLLKFALLFLIFSLFHVVFTNAHDDADREASSHQAIYEKLDSFIDCFSAFPGLSLLFSLLQSFFFSKTPFFIVPRVAAAVFVFVFFDIHTFTIYKFRLAMFIKWYVLNASTEALNMQYLWAWCD